MQIHVAFLMRRHGRLPTEALEKPLMGHSLSVSTHTGNCSQSVSQYGGVRENTLCASIG